MITRTTCPIILLVVLWVCFPKSPTLAATIQEIERLPFDDAYRQWLQETEWGVKDRTIVSSGEKDSKTGKITPTTFWALTCRLGRDAHLHESFLVSALTTNEYVSMILDTSSRLCSRYGIKSEAAVRFDPKLGYTWQIIEFGHGPKWQRSLWLKAMKKPSSQPAGAANGSQPSGSETNRPSAAAGSRR